MPAVALLARAVGGSHHLLHLAKQCCWLAIGVVVCPALGLVQDASKLVVLVKELAPVLNIGNLVVVGG